MVLVVSTARIAGDSITLALRHVIWNARQGSRDARPSFSEMTRAAGMLGNILATLVVSQHKCAYGSQLGLLRASGFNTKPARYLKGHSLQ